jgi:hypothetical protein
VAAVPTISLLHVHCYISRRMASMHTSFFWHAVYCCISTLLHTVISLREWLLCTLHFSGMLCIVIISLVEWLVCTVYPCVLLFLCSKSGCCVLCTMHCLHRTHVAFSPSIFLSVRPPEARRLIPPSPELVFLNLYGAQESMPRHQFRQPM